MCIAILKPKGKVLSKELLENCSVNNPDGCGFAYVDNKNEVVIKKFMDFKSFWKSYRWIQKNHTMLIHFRIATHGNVELNNCHPFKLNDKMALIHNGVISGYGSRTDNLSDTKDFIDKVIGNISYKMWKNPSFRTLVGSSIGSSKLAILDNNENYYIINEDKGSWDDGVWFSNGSYKREKKVVQATTPSTKTSETKTQTQTDNKATENNWGYIMRCPECGKEYVVRNWYENSCKNCKCKLDTVGYVYKGNKVYYQGNQRYGYYDYSYDY